MSAPPAAPKPRRRRSLASLGVILLALTVTGGLYSVLAPGGASGPATAEAATSTAAAQSDVEAGRALFLSNCSSCHGRNAEGTTDDGPSLIGVGAAAVDFQVSTGRMPLAKPDAQAPRGRVLFDDEQIRQMAAYIASLAPGPAVPSQEQLDYEHASAAEGGEIFRTNCSMCHNYAGSGGALTQGKYAPKLSGVEPRHIYEAMLTGPQAMPVFSDRQITPEQKQAIIKYLKTIEDEPTPGGRSLGSIGPVAEGLFGWVVGLGLLVASAVWLAQKAK